MTLGSDWSHPEGLDGPTPLDELDAAGPMARPRLESRPMVTHPWPSRCTDLVLFDFEFALQQGAKRICIDTIRALIRRAPA